MGFRNAIGATALAATLMVMMIGSAAAAEETKYPNMNGQWRNPGNGGLSRRRCRGASLGHQQPARPHPSL